MRAIRIMAFVVLFGVVGVAVVLGLIWLDHTRETTLPTPTGPLAVGCVTYVWSDAAQAQLMATRPGTTRETACLGMVSRCASTTIADSRRVFTRSVAGRR
jgi:hypothetical protein